MSVKSDPANMDILISSDRRRSLDLHRLLSLLPMQPHHRVADIGCGPGYLTLPLAKYLFDGKVFAMDVQQKMLDAAQESLSVVNLSNVELMRSKERKLPLEDDSLDGAVLAFVLQEATYPKALLNETMRCLKNSGWLAIMEWHKIKMDEGPPLEQRIEEDDMRSIAEKLGLRFAGRYSLNGMQYMLNMRK